jgi:dolichol kinase
MMKRLLSPGKLLAQTIAAVAIAVFWCISAVGTTVGTTIGVTSLAAAVTAATSTTADAGRRRRRRRRRKRSRRWYGGKWVPWWAYEYY